MTRPPNKANYLGELERQKNLRRKERLKRQNQTTLILFNTHRILLLLLISVILTR